MKSAMADKDIFKKITNMLLIYVGNFSNDDGDSNENVEKAIGNQNNNSARALHFLVYFFAVTARQGRQVS